jgi:3-methyl-2-oxobutanoate hydroxymethyltransferase
MIRARSRDLAFHCSIVNKITPDTIRSWKGTRRRISALTAYDFPTARLLDEAGIDLLLVGDSLGMTVLGYPDTTHVQMEDVIYHTRAVARGVSSALLVADLPIHSYDSVDLAVENSRRLIDAGAHAVKLEGGQAWSAQIRAITEAGIPFVGHIGMLPQHVREEGGYRIKGRTAAELSFLLNEARVIEENGGFALVLELIDRSAAGEITQSVSIATIGIGSGTECDGQILVFHDLVNLSFSKSAKFVRQYGDAAALFRTAIASYVQDVEQRTFPKEAESYHLPKEAKAELDLIDLVRATV